MYNIHIRVFVWWPSHRHSQLTPLLFRRSIMIYDNIVCTRWLMRSYAKVPLIVFARSVQTIVYVFMFGHLPPLYVLLNTLCRCWIASASIRMRLTFDESASYSTVSSFNHFFSILTYLFSIVLYKLCFCFTGPTSI